MKNKYAELKKISLFKKLFWVSDGILVFFLFCGKDFGF